MATFKPTYRVHCTPRSQTLADCDSVTFPLVLKYVGFKDWDTQKGDRQLTFIIINKTNLHLFSQADNEDRTRV